MNWPTADERPGYLPVGVAEGYDRWAASYDHDPNPLIAVEEPVVVELFGDVAGLQVLDLGCGTGRYCTFLTKQGARVTGIDLSPGMIRHALRRSTFGPAVGQVGNLPRRNLPNCATRDRNDDQGRQAIRKQAGSALHVIQAELARLCLPDNHFDLILCALTLNHVERLGPVFAEATRVLKRGGRIILSDFHPYWVVFGHNYTEFFDEAGQEYRIPCYAHRFEEYWRLFEQHGWQLETLREPLIDDRLTSQFPALESYRGVPLALVMCLSYPSL
jgi:ubiquinone/menaquinone biosynthesis C-methylase UbiE